MVLILLAFSGCALVLGLLTQGGSLATLLFISAFVLALLALCAAILLRARKLVCPGVAVVAMAAMPFVAAIGEARRQALQKVVVHNVRQLAQAIHGYASKTHAAGHESFPTTLEEAVAWKLVDRSKTSNPFDDPPGDIPAEPRRFCSQKWQRSNDPRAIMLCDWRPVMHVGHPIWWKPARVVLWADGSVAVVEESRFQEFLLLPCNADFRKKLMSAM